MKTVNRFEEAQKSIFWAACFCLMVASRTSDFEKRSEHGSGLHAKMLAESVVKIEVPGSGTGTGFAIKHPDGTTALLTNWHVCRFAIPIDGKKFVAVVISDGTKSAQSVIRLDRKSDLCMLTSPEIPPLTLAKTVVAPQGRIFTAGYPGSRYSTSSGHESRLSLFEVPIAPDDAGRCPHDTVRRTNRTSSSVETSCVSRMVLFDTDMKSALGASGSPVVNQQGFVIGVVNSVHTSYGTASMIPLSSLRAFMGLGKKQRKRL